MTVHHLSEISFDQLLDCFLLAFEDYIIKMPTDKDYYWERWKASKVDYKYSYGMVDEGRLVGFIINAIDKREGILTAFNTGTGVIPAYRGRRIVQSIYEYAFKDLLKYGITRCTLEVITNNDKAVRLYEGIGFKKTKTYKCYAGDIMIDEKSNFKLEEISLSSADWDSLPNQDYYSWDFQKETLLGGNYFLYRVLFDNKPESFFIINPKNTYLAQFDILNANDGSWKRLFSAIKNISGKIKVNNVDDRLHDKLYYLSLYGLKNAVDQYEMELFIESVV